ISDLPDFVSAVALSPDNHTLAVAIAGFNVQIYDAQTFTLLRTLSDQPFAIAPWDIAFSPDGRLFCSGNEMWDTGTWRKLPFSAHIRMFIRQVAFSPDGELVALSSDHGPVTIWSV